MCSHRPPVPASIYRYWCRLKEAKQKYPDNIYQMECYCYMTVPITLIDRASRYFHGLESADILLYRLLDWCRRAAFEAIEEGVGWEEPVVLHEM